jgi:hypothetical protein
MGINTSASAGLSVMLVGLGRRVNITSSIWPSDTNSVVFAYCRSNPVLVFPWFSLVHYIWRVIPSVGRDNGRFVCTMSVPYHQLYLNDYTNCVWFYIRNDYNMNCFHIFKFLSEVDSKFVNETFKSCPKLFT